MITNLTLSQPQVSFLQDTSRIVLACCGRGSGKTWILCLSALQTAINYQGGLFVLCAANPAMLNTVVVKQLTDLLDQCGIQWCKGSDPPWFKSSLTSHTNVLSIENGSQFLLRSYFESGADRNLRGISCQGIFIDEGREVDEQIFDVLSATLRGGKGPWIIRTVSTPAGHDWMYKKFVDPETKIPDAVIHRWQTKDNAHNLPQGYIEQLRSQMSLDLFRQEILGEFIDLGRGARVYKFESSRHVKPVSFNPSTGFLGFSMDFNISPLIGVVCLINEPKKFIHVIDEIIMKDNGRTQTLCEMFASKYRPITHHVAWMGDEAGGHRDTRQSESDLAIMKNTLGRYFTSMRPLNDGRKPRVIERVNSTNAMFDPAMGEPRIFIDPRCKTLIEDLNNVCWDEDGSRTIDKSDPKYTHASDALSYLCERLFGLQRSGLVTVKY